MAALLTCDSRSATAACAMACCRSSAPYRACGCGDEERGAVEGTAECNRSLALASADRLAAPHADSHPADAHTSSGQPAKPPCRCPAHLQRRQLALCRLQLSSLNLSGRQQLVVRSSQQLLKLHLALIKRGHCGSDGWNTNKRLRFLNKS